MSEIGIEYFGKYLFLISNTDVYYFNLLVESSLNGFCHQFFVWNLW
jgi:hypothetical protein